MLASPELRSRTAGRALNFSSRSSGGEYENHPENPPEAAGKEADQKVKQVIDGFLLPDVHGRLAARSAMPHFLDGGFHVRSISAKVLLLLTEGVKM